MFYFWKGRFPPRTSNKLKQWNIAPCKILWKVNDNAFHVELLKWYNIFTSFSVADLFDFCGDEDEELAPVRLLETTPKDRIE